MLRLLPHHKIAYLHRRVPEDHGYHYSASRNLSTSARDGIRVNGCSKATGTTERWRTSMLKFQTLGKLSVSLKKA